MSINLSTQDYNIGAACVHYDQTGEVLDILLPAFDQNGVWMGIGPESTSETSNKIANHRLPAHRIERVDDEGRHLLTSYYKFASDPEEKIPYCSVDGCIDVMRAKAVDAPLLKSVGGSFNAVSALKVNAPLLKNVGENLRLRDVNVLNIESLEEIGGQFYGSPHILNAPSLKTVGGLFYCGQSDILELPELTKVGGSMDAQECKEFQAPNLKSVGGYLAAPECDPSLSSLRSLEEVNGACCTNNLGHAKLPNLQKIPESETIYVKEGQLSLEDWRNLKKKVKKVKEIIRSQKTMCESLEL